MISYCGAGCATEFSGAADFGFLGESAASGVALLTTPRSKAAIVPRNQDFDATGVDSEKSAKIKGGNFDSESNIKLLLAHPLEFD